MENWNADAETPAFAEAVRFIVAGDAGALRETLDAHPDVARAKSVAAHGASLLHYSAANGVEAELQKTPRNAVEIARILIEHGAPIDDPAFGGGPHGTPLASLCSSVHPYLAGLQAQLVHVFLDGGAAIEGVDGDGVPLGFALAFGYTAAAEALVKRGARHDYLLAAAGLGHMDALSTYITRDGVLLPSALKYTTGDRDEAGRYSWPPPRKHDPAAQALIYACIHGRMDAVTHLLDCGVPVDAAPSYGQTGLHFACNLAHSEVAYLLVERGANVNAVERQMNGTPADWSDEYKDDPVLTAFLRARMS